VTGSGAVVSNPERYLNEHTLKFTFNELFPSPESLAPAVKNVCALNKALCGSNPDLPAYLRNIADGHGWWARALSGVAVSIDLGERQALQQGVIVAENSFTNHYQVSGGVDFDPVNLFIGGANWKAVLTAVPDQKLCGGPPFRNCIDSLSRPRFFAPKFSAANLVTKPNRGIVVLAAVVPVVSFKRVSQFDFIKSGGVLVSTPYLENAQNQFTLKWDLKRAIPSSASLPDASVLTPEPPATSARLCIVVSSEGIRSFIPVSQKFPVESCSEFAKQSKQRFALGCVGEQGITQGDPIPADDKEALDVLLNALKAEKVPEKVSCWKPGPAESQPGGS
jgi:hypothetical protein